MLSVRLSSYEFMGSLETTKRSIVLGAAVESPPNFSRAFFGGTIDANLKTGANSLIATEQNFPQFLPPSWLGVKRGKKYNKYIQILANFETWYLLLNLTQFDSENVSFSALVLRLFS